MGAFFTLMFALIFGIMLISGSGTVNGEEVTSRASILTSAMTSIILIPVIVVVHAFMFGGILLLGTWIFRRRGKLTIEGHDASSTF